MQPSKAEIRKSNIVFVITTLAIFAVWSIIIYHIEGSYSFVNTTTSLICTFCTFLLIGAIKEIVRRWKNGIEISATLETDVEKVKSHMLFIMQWGHQEGIVGALAEFSRIFRNYPQWELSKWEVFCAWYKCQIDDMLKYPEIYKMTMKSDDSPYAIEKDPLYDPDAPDWSQFDRDHSHDFDDDDDDDDFDCREMRGSWSNTDALYFGMGMGVADGLMDGHDSGGDSGTDTGGDCDGLG